MIPIEIVKSNRREWRVFKGTIELGCYGRLRDARAYARGYCDRHPGHTVVESRKCEPSIACMCGAINPPTPIAEDGLPRCIYCGCH